jgi:hypothetical protein
MKIFTSLLVNRLFTSTFIITCLLISSKASALIENNNPGVEYASLAASASEKGVFINWVTVSEQNNSHFEVERSTDMRSFKTVAMVLDGFAATGTNGKSYKFKEASGLVSKVKTVYYRLKQIDVNSQVHYSAVMAVHMNSAVTVFPKKDDVQSNIVKIDIDYRNSLKLLSKQPTSGIGDKKMPVAVSTTGILNACEMILGVELCSPQLTMS